MNDGHAQLCSSPAWAEFIACDVVPATLGSHVLGKELLEIGPGYGASTAQLVTMGCDLTVVEIDTALAITLRGRFPAVRVVHGCGEDLPFSDGSFTTVCCFTMLHHVHSVAAQDAMFAGIRRVLGPGGLFAGSDSIASPGLRSFHHDDIYTPVDPHALPGRLEAAGFADITIELAQKDEWFTFSARCV